MVPMTTLAIMAVGTERAMPLQPIRPYTTRTGAPFGMAHEQAETDRAELDGHHAQDEDERDGEPLDLVPDERRRHVREDDEVARQRHVGQPDTPRRVADLGEQRLGARGVQGRNPGDDSERRVALPALGQEPMEVGRRLLVRRARKSATSDAASGPSGRCAYVSSPRCMARLTRASRSGRPVTLRTSGRPRTASSSRATLSRVRGPGSTPRRR